MIASLGLEASPTNEDAQKATDISVTETALEEMLGEISPARVALGLPLYTRAWSEEMQDYSGDTEPVEAEVLAKQLQNMQDKKLAGAAFWRLGVESEGIWEVISLYIE